MPKIHYTSFPVASPQQVRNINDKSVTSWQLPRLRGSYGPTCVMDFRSVGQKPLGQNPLGQKPTFLEENT